MLLQTILLPFDGGSADTIYTKQGETGRGVSFELPFTIDPEDLSDYKAEFIAVKPDDTFVIEDCSIVSHGADETLHTAAIITLPEQVSAAKGTGSYILKIYDYVHDGDLIYSAAGGLYVDDHLLLDSLIESVAEVNGYNFPDDFLTRDDLENIIDDTATRADRTWSSDKISAELADVWEGIGDLIDDTSTGSDTTTWSSNKISAELADMSDDIDDVENTVTTLADRFNFSSTEKAVGTWTDGRTLYRKTISFSAPQNNDWTSRTHGISGIQQIISAECYLSINTGEVYPIPQFRSAANYVCISASPTSIDYINTWMGNALNPEITVNLFYTKS